MAQIINWCPAGPIISAGITNLSSNMQNIAKSFDCITGALLKLLQYLIKLIHLYLKQKNLMYLNICIITPCYKTRH
jgi:hypothetical protein